MTTPVFENGTQPRPESIERRLARVEEKLDRLLDETSRRGELMDEMRPIAREVMRVATDRLAGLEAKGYFDFGRELLGIVDRVVTSYSPEDVRALGENVVRILDTVRRVTQPEVLAVAGEATEALEHADRVKPVGAFGLLRASRDQDVQRGLAVAMEVLRQIGRGVKGHPVEGDRRARLAARTAPRRLAEPATPAKAARHCAPSTVVSPPAGGGGVDLPGYALGADGHLADPDAWSESFARAMAAALGIAAMTDQHWNLIRAARDEFLKVGAAPNIRRLTAISGLSTKAIYELFPKAPGKAVARIAGIPKPAGCI